MSEACFSESRSMMAWAREPVSGRRFLQTVGARGVRIPQAVYHRGLGRPAPRPRREGSCKVSG